VTLVLRKQHTQDRIEGLDSFDWGEDDYAVVDETQVVDDRQIGRICLAPAAPGRAVTAINHNRLRRIPC
jgi:hypothetical protein